MTRLIHKQTREAAAKRPAPAVGGDWSLNSEEDSRDEVTPRDEPTAVTGVGPFCRHTQHTPMFLRHLSLTSSLHLADFQFSFFPRSCCPTMWNPFLTQSIHLIHLTFFPWHFIEHIISEATFNNALWQTPVPMIHYVTKSTL